MIGEKLKELRKAKGITSETLCNDIGIASGSYRNYERNDRNPPYDVLLKIADYYNVSLDYLFDREKQKNPLLEMTVKPINDDEMWAEYEKLPDIAKEIFIEVMEILVKASRKKESKEIKQNVYPIPTFTCGKKGMNIEYMTEEEINDILLAEDADEDL